MPSFPTSDFNSNPDTANHKFSTECQRLSHPGLDAAIAKLLTHLDSFADKHSEVCQMNLNLEEIHQIVAVLTQEWTMQLDGRQIAGTLLAILEREAFQP